MNCTNQLEVLDAIPGPRLADPVPGQQRWSERVPRILRRSYAFGVPFLLYDQKPIFCHMGTTMPGTHLGSRIRA